MSRGASENWGSIISSLALAMILTAIPLPDLLAAVRPGWVALVLVYWVIAVPHKVGVVTAWITGLFLDVLSGTVLGQHALALSLIAYITYVLHLRIRVFPLWQQCLSMIVLIGLYQLVNIMIMRAVNMTPGTLYYWLAVLSTGLVWPLVKTGMGYLRGHVVTQ